MLKRTTGADLSWLFESLGGVIQTRSLAVASVALFIYDWIITFDQEVGGLSTPMMPLLTSLSQFEHFWKGSWSASRILFLLVSLGIIQSSTKDLS